MKVLRLFFLSLVVACSVGVFAQVELIGPQQYPQFRGVSGLPGGGFALRYDGTVGYGGAMALSTPVAFSLGHWRSLLNVSLLSTDGAIPPFSKSGASASFLNANGTTNQMVGIKLGDVGYLTVSNMIVSTKGDNTTNYHFSFSLGDGASVAVGIQDITGQIGSAGDTFPADDVRLSRSAYGVVTVPIDEKTHASVGIGTERFRRPFGNVSSWVTGNFILFAEHDGYNWNSGFGWDLGSLGFSSFGYDAKLFVNGGLVRGKYPFWGFNVVF